jgi:hypothetical protein
VFGLDAATLARREIFQADICNDVDSDMVNHK